jgi:hypothetical protein
MTPAAIGFRAHTGWAAMVAVAGNPEGPTIIDRRRIELIHGSEQGHVYHAARELNLPAARALVARVLAESSARARGAIAAAVEEFREKGWRVGAAGVVLGNSALPSELERILASHALVHSAEGELFRKALVSGSEACGLAVSGVPANALHQRAREALSLGPSDLERRLAELGKAAGRPWAQDQKESAIVAWVALALHLGARK